MEADQEHGAQHNDDVREHANDVLEWIEQVVAEDIDLLLEDFENFSNWRDIKECVNWCEQDSIQGDLQDISTHVTLVALDDQVSQVTQENGNCGSNGSSLHVS